MSTKHPRTTLLAVAIAGTAGLGFALAAPLAASAHVTISPNSAEPGAYALVTIRVPNESATASTASVEVQLPDDTPFSSVSYTPVPGWSTDLVRTTFDEPITVGDSEIPEAVTSVVWTAEPGSEIGDGQLQQFDLSLGPVPEVGSIALPAVQTYTDGTVVEWTETAEGAEHPAPVLSVTDAPAADHHGGAGGHDDAVVAASATSPASGAPDDVLARVLAIGGLVVGAVGIVLAISARRVSKP